MQVHRVWCVVLTMSLVACASDATSSNGTSATTTGIETTPPPSMVSSDSTTTAPGTSPTTTTAPTDELPLARFSAADLPTDAPCVRGAAPADGETTFVVDGKLWAVSASGDVSCVADLVGRDPTWIQWSPDGDEVLVGPDVVLRDDGRFVPTGYLPDNRTLRWSLPTGKALIAPNAESGKLIWRNAHDSGERIDVSFAERTTVAAYHPAGKHLIAAGIGSDGGGEGVFVATNRGKNMQRIGQIESGEVTDLDFEMSGNSVVFVHRHDADGISEVHRYSFDSGFLEVVATVPGEAVTGLVASPVELGALAWSTTHSTLSSQLWVQAPGADPVAIGIPESILQPLSWLPNHQLLFTRTGPAAPPGAAVELWSWSDGTLSHIIDGVSAAAARTIHGPYLELNIIQGSGFG